MAEGLIALAEHGQVAIVTPFTLAGAMAPVVAGRARWSCNMPRRCSAWR